MTGTRLGRREATILVENGGRVPSGQALRTSLARAVVEAWADSSRQPDREI